MITGTYDEIISILDLQGNEDAADPSLSPYPQSRNEGERERTRSPELTPTTSRFLILSPSPTQVQKTDPKQKRKPTPKQKRKPTPKQKRKPWKPRIPTVLQPADVKPAFPSLEGDTTECLV